jgi:acetyl esterase
MILSANKEVGGIAPGSEIDADILAVRMYQAKLVEPFDVMRLPVDEGRARMNAAALLLNDGLPAMADVVEYNVNGEGGSLRVRLYTPPEAGDGAIFFIHGGGWFACDIDTHDRTMRFLARESGKRVVGLDYRLAPEHPFPAALDDTCSVWRWLTDGPLALAAGSVALAGDSAGANLALALALRERDAGRPLPAGLALAYGCYAPGMRTDSRQRYGDGTYGLTGARMDWFWANYLGSGNECTEAVPIYARLEGLPPVYLSIAECDVLADESRHLAFMLRNAGVITETEIWPGAVHGFLQMTRDAQIARNAATAMASALSGFLRQGGTR